jgi:transcriptional/translational regulatory protein YebC/TACO1
MLSIEEARKLLGEDGDKYTDAEVEQIRDEAYGPGGTAFLIECLSDNRNRTSANVKSVITKHGGRVADSGSVAWMFERKGLVIGESASAAATADKSRLEELELELIDFGAETARLTMSPFTQFTYT